MMRILYFHQYFSTPEGATGTRSYEMARVLVERGHQVTVVCGSYSTASTGLTGPFVRGKRSGDVDGISVLELRLPLANKDSLIKRTATFIRFALASLWAALVLPCDLVIATSTPLTAAIPGIASRWIRCIPFVFEVRDLWPELPRAMGVVKNPVVLVLMGWLEWMGYHSACRCIGLSPGIVRGIASRGIPESKIHMIPNGCDLDLFSTASASIGADMRGAVADRGVFTALFAGAHGVANGLDAVLDMAAELKTRGRTDIKVLLVGDGRMKPSLESRVSDEDLPVEFRDPMPKPELAALMRDVGAGLMILADVPEFYFGTSPNKFFDYIAASLPVINNYPGWLADLIVRNECGVVAPPRDAASFADALEKLADDPALRGRMAANARALAERDFDRRELAVRFAEVVESARC